MNNQRQITDQRSSFPVERLQFDLPEDLIAEKPCAHRDGSRMLILQRSSGDLSDRMIRELPDFVRPGDLLVINNTKVLPAKFEAFRETGGRIPGLFVEILSSGNWKVMLEGASKLQPREKLTVRGQGERNGHFVAVGRLEGGYWEIEIPGQADPEDWLGQFGSPPLPPYIAKKRKTHPTEIDDADRYQTVYAREPGAIAAPTAGLHLTSSLMQQIKDKGASFAEVTLHVGIGTFKPIKAEDLAKHDMHGERFEIGATTIEAIRKCKADGGRVLAVGTTTVRVLETVAQQDNWLQQEVAISGETHAFFYPPWNFRCIDGLLTNFHLPKSTLIAMIMAFAGEDQVMNAYRHAVTSRYRFFSYGDAMLIV